ncbi:MAG: class I adenylate-forming enzyme family protein [Eubacteriales bacterium]|nr:class I adenylate-forming enzyme family protein [Eubacteriales bacterium]MDY3333015.1 class I adenylate-forming enzyme family protein [Gallibacter sp.]
MEFTDFTIGQLLSNKIDNIPDRPALIGKSGVYSWKDIDHITNLICEQMESYGIKQGEKVAILGVNCGSWLVHYLSVVKYGAVAVLLNTRFTKYEIKKCLDNTEVTHIFYSKDNNKNRYDDMVKELIEICPTLKSSCYMKKDYDKWKKMAQAGSTYCYTPTRDPHEIINILFTSGTTGEPKAVPLSHYNLLNNAIAMAENMRWTSEDCMCVTVPLFHSFGITGCILAMLHTGGSLVFVNSTRSVDIFEMIQAVKPTILSGVPTMFLAMSRNINRPKYDLTSLKSGIIAGSQIFPQDFYKICDAFPNLNLVPAYGQTETSPCVTMCDYDDSVQTKANTVGKPLQDVEIRIIKNDLFDKCGINVEGCIQVKGYNVMKGYLHNDEQNSQSFSEDGWLRTGDLGYVRDDGYLVITGRKKNLIIRGGENISPLEIEKTIKEVDPEANLKVFGVPTLVLQEEIVACIEGKEDESKREKIFEYLKEHLSAYKIPKYIFFVEDMPKNSTGKINEKLLKDMIIQNLTTISRKAL